MDPRLLQYYNLELQHLREMGAEFAQQFPKIAARLGMNGLEVADPYVERLLEGVGVPRRARAAQARRRVPALHAGAARDRLSALPRADAVDAGGAAAARRRTTRTWRAASDGAARQHAASARSAARRCDRVRVPHRARRHAVADRGRVGELLLVRARPAAQHAADRAADQGRPADPAEDDRRAQVRADCRSIACAFYLAGRDDVANKLLRAVPGDRRSACWCCRPTGRDRAGTSSCRRRTIRAGRLHRRRGAAAGDAALVPGLPAAAGVFLVPAALPLLRADGAGAGAAARRRQRARARAPPRPRRCRRSRASSTRRTSRCSARRRSTCSTKRADRIHVERRRATSTTSCADRTRPLDFEVYEVTERRRARRRRPTASSSSCRSTRRTAPTSEHQQSAYFTTRREPRLVAVGRSGAAARARATSAPRCSCRWSMPRRRRSAATCASCRSRRCAPTATWCCRCRWASATERLLARHRRAGGEHPRDQRPEPSVRAAGRRRGRLARDQPSVAQLPVAASTRRRQEGAAALRDLLELYARRRRRQRAAADRRHPVGAAWPPRRCRRAAGARARSAFGRGLEITVEVDELAFEGGSAFLLGVGAGPLLRALRVDQLVHRNRAALADARRDQPMGAAVGRETDALAFLVGAGGGAVPLRLLPDAAAARVPVRRPSRAGARRSGRSTSRCGSGRIRTCRLRRRRWRRSSSGRTARRRACRCRLFGLLGPNGPLPLHLTEYARERLRHAGDPTLSRFLDIFHHRFLALFYRAWAQAQPHVNRDRPERRSLPGLRRRVPRRRAAGACAIATRCRTWRSSFTSAR